MKLCGVIFFLFFMCAAFAQQPVVQVSNPTKLPPKTTKFRVLGKNNDGIIVRLYGSEDVIDVYDEQLKLSTVKNIDFKNQNGLSQYIMLNKSGAVIFYLQQDKKYSVLLAQPVNSKFIEAGKPVVIDTIYDRRDLISLNLRFKQSFDQSHLMIYYPYFSGTKITSIKFITLTHSLQTLYNRTMVFNRDERELEESKNFVDNNGNCYLVVKPLLGAPGVTTYDVFRISAEGEPVTYNLVTQKLLFGEAYFDIDNKNGNMTMGAFYNDQKTATEDVANGFVYSTFNPADGKVIKADYTLFPKDFIATLTNRPAGDVSKLYTFNIRRTILRNDGGMLIIAESLIKDSREVPSNMGMQPGFNTYRTSILYQFNDIIAFSIDSAGKVDWSTVMRKKQSSEDDNGTYSSFMTVNEKDKLHLIYLDDVSSSGILNQYILSSDSKTTRLPILNQEEKDLMLLTKMGRQISPNQVVIPSYKGGALRLAKITF